MTDQEFMALALEEALSAAARGEVPVGAVVVGADGVVLARAANDVIGPKDPTGHAEMRAIRAAATALGNERLVGATLYVTLEPCTMCAGAVAQARIARLVYGAVDPKGGAVESGVRFFDQPTCHHRPEIVAGVAAGAASAMLKAFFRARR